MAAGKQAMWHYTHNSYTELSSETGFPGLFLFLFAFYRGYKGLSTIRSRYKFTRVGRGALSYRSRSHVVRGRILPEYCV